MKVCSALLLVVMGIAWAQTAPPKARSIIGEVTAFDAGARQMTVKTDSGGTEAVRLDAATKFLRVPPGEKDLSKATPIQMSDLNTGDRVLARGGAGEGEGGGLTARVVVVMTKTDLARKHEEERQAWLRGVSGTVTDVNPGTKQVTVKPRGAEARPVIVDVSGAGFLRYAPGSYQFSEAKPGTLEEIRVGDTLRARGAKSEDSSTVKAEQVLSGSFETIAATVVSVDAAAGMVRVTDLQTKKPAEIKTSGRTLVRRIPEEMAAMMARRLQARGAPDGAGGGQGAAAVAAGAGAEARPAGARGPGQRGNFDLQQALERMPPMPLAELKKGDAVIISSTKGGDALTAIALVAGVEPFLQAAPRQQGGRVDLGNWNFEGGIPSE